MESTLFINLFGRGDGIMEQCAITGCKREVETYYYGKAVCNKHWLLHCSEKPFNLKKTFGIKDEKETQFTLL